MTTIAQAAASSPLAPFGVTEASTGTRILEDLSVAGKGPMRHHRLSTTKYESRSPRWRPSRKRSESASRARERSAGRCRCIRGCGRRVDKTGVAPVFLASMRRLAGLLFALVLFQTTVAAVILREDCPPDERRGGEHRTCGPFCTHCTCCTQVGSVTLDTPTVAPIVQKVCIERSAESREPLAGFIADILHIPR